jgi:hypothetical protein
MNLEPLSFLGGLPAAGEVSSRGWYPGPAAGRIFIFREGLTAFSTGSNLYP